MRLRPVTVAGVPAASAATTTVAMKIFLVWRPPWPEKYV